MYMNGRRDQLRTLTEQRKALVRLVKDLRHSVCSVNRKKIEEILDEVSAMSPAQFLSNCIKLNEDYPVLPPSKPWGVLDQELGTIRGEHEALQAPDPTIDKAYVTDIRPVDYKLAPNDGYIETRRPSFLHYDVTPPNWGGSEATLTYPETPDGTSSEIIHTGLYFHNRELGVTSPVSSYESPFFQFD
jgi:hypothetical protein